jgi:uncharacterized membrane protein YuzA (DUF378 family)
MRRCLDLAKLAPLDLLAIVLVIVGGLNWGLYAFGYNLVSILLGWMPILEKVVYVVVALAAIYLAAITAKLSKR